LLLIRGVGRYETDSSEDGLVMGADKTRTADILSPLDASVANDTDREAMLSLSLTLTPTDEPQKSDGPLADSLRSTNSADNSPTVYNHPFILLIQMCS